MGHKNNNKILMDNKSILLLNKEIEYVRNSNLEHKQEYLDICEKYKHIIDRQQMFILKCNNFIYDIKIN